MTIAFKYFLFLLCSSVLVLGMAQKRQLEQAQKFEQNERFFKAASIYKEILLDYPKLEEAKKGLRRTSNNILESKLLVFQNSCEKHNYELAISSFDEACYLKLQLLYFNIDLNIPRHNYITYDDVRRDMCPILTIESKL